MKNVVVCAIILSMIVTVDTQLTYMESISILESRLKEKSIKSLKQKAKVILEKTPDREVPSWDSID